jgi:hypothetical protein
LSLKHIQVDNDLFPISAIDLQGAKVPLQPEQTDHRQKRPKSCEDMILSREVVVEKDADGKDVLKITVKASGLEGGQAGDLKQDWRSVQ